MIVPIEREICGRVQQYFQLGGKVEVPRPRCCPRRREECGSTEPMRKNGSYARQVIYWGLLFVLSILRFRCGRCGKTVSRPYSWLVPYKRFSAEVVAAGAEAYATRETTYRAQSGVLSEPEFLEPEMDIRQTRLYSELQKKGAITRAQTRDEGCRPSHCAVFRWVEFVCRRSEVVVQQLQKELVRRQKDLKHCPKESVVKNPNSYKAQPDEKGEKAQQLNRLTFGSVVARLLLGGEGRLWGRLRAYFLTQAEHCRDLLTDAPAGLSSAHTLQLAVF